MRFAFNDADAPNAKQRQYCEMFGNRAIWADGWKAVTIHANRMPWDVNVTLPFDEDGRGPSIGSNTRPDLVKFRIALAASG
jgi:arylsulfatase A-like enzyme